MIVGLGIDLVELQRIRRVYEKWGDRFARRFLSDAELDYKTEESTAWLAGRFAAKEACAKALGTGFQAGVLWHDMRVLPNRLGKPEMILQGKALEISQNLGARHLHLSITHERMMACAVLILET